MARKTAAERCGLLLVAEDVERMKELFEDETGASYVDFAAIGRVVFGTMLHMAYGYDRDKIRELFGGMDRIESITLRDMIRRHDDYKEHYVKRCANMSRRKKAETDNG